MFQVLEKLGIKPKRVAGASAGAIVAALVAAGYNSAEMKDVLEMNIDTFMMGMLNILEKAQCGNTQVAIDLVSRLLENKNSYNCMLFTNNLFCC